LNPSSINPFCPRPGLSRFESLLRFKGKKMTDDTYDNYAALKRKETRGRDYCISIRNISSPVTIVAPHGGQIEPGTSDIADRIASSKFNFYSFNGIKPDGNRRLHITSHRFDEPQALALISRSLIVVAIHACTGNTGRIYLGGLDDDLKHHMARTMKVRKLEVALDDFRFKGANPENICNRGLTRKGVQLEISRDLRDDRSQRALIANIVRDVLNSRL
jgi:phage replication-related protein YjqB (UPF0714/DUF867 family)